MTWTITARSIRHEWPVVHGLASRAEAKQALRALLASQGLHATGPDGRRVMVAYVISEDEPCPR